MGLGKWKQAQEAKDAVFKRLVEDTLVKDKTFKLPGKRVPGDEVPSIEYIVVDVTESPNRPQKPKRVLFGKRSGIL